MDLNKNDQAVHDERARIYGDATDGHRNFGLIITALIQGHYDITLPHPVPADVALLIMAGGKLNRASRANVYHADNYVDGKVYCALADEAKKKTGAPPVGPVLDAKLEDTLGKALEDALVVFQGSDATDPKEQKKAKEYFFELLKASGVRSAEGRNA